MLLKKNCPAYLTFFKRTEEEEDSWTNRSFHHNFIFTDIYLILFQNGDLDKIKTLLQRRNESLISIDVRDTETGNTAIIWASKRGHTKVLTLLFQKRIRNLISIYNPTFQN